MKQNCYEFSNYTDADIEGIVTLEGYLWKQDEITRREYFHWKHLSNPLLEKAVCIVARNEGKVIGVRGYVPVEWKIRTTKFKILLTSDTVVHPEYRGKGVFSALTKAGMKLYQDEYKYFVAFTPNNLSIPGYLKLSWKPIVIRRYLRHLSLLGLVRQIIIGGVRSRLGIGNYGDIEVSDRFYADDISKIANSNYYSENKLSQNMTPDFIKWKLSNPIDSYLFLYHRTESGIDAYIVLRLFMDHAHIFDYGQEKGSLGIHELISFIVEHGKFLSVSVLSAGMSEELRAFLRKKHFYSFGQIERIIRPESYNLSILVRPTKEYFIEDDWYIEGADVRDIKNWHITEICFD